LPGESLVAVDVDLRDRGVALGRQRFDSRLHHPTRATRVAVDQHDIVRRRDLVEVRLALDFDRGLWAGVRVLAVGGFTRLLRFQLLALALADSFEFVRLLAVAHRPWIGGEFCKT